MFPIFASFRTELPQVKACSTVLLTLTEQAFTFMTATWRDHQVFQSNTANCLFCFYFFLIGLKFALFKILLGVEWYIFQGFILGAFVHGFLKRRSSVGWSEKLSYSCCAHNAMQLDIRGPFNTMNENSERRFCKRYNACTLQCRGLTNAVWPVSLLHNEGLGLLLTITLYASFFLGGTVCFSGASVMPHMYVLVAFI